jgi:membrane fusion protein (multidrug efflux system)
MRKPIVFLPLFFLLFSCSSHKQEMKPSGNGSREAEVLEVEGQIVTTSSISEVIEVTGTILASEATEIRPEISGRIIQLYIREGAAVGANSLLAKLYDGDLQAQLKKLLVQLQIAEKTEERQRELLKIGGVAQQDYDLSVLQVSNIKADIELTRVAIAKTEIRAPYNGRLGLRNISIGAYVSPSTLLTTISQVRQKKLEFSVPEKYSAQITPGLPVELLMDGTGNLFTASVLARESSVDQTTRNLRVRALINEDDPLLVPGSFSKVRLILGRNDRAIMIPSNAIIPQARNKQVAVYRSGKASMEQVTTGIRDSSLIQVLSGLNPGDTLITTGLLFVKSGSNIRFSNLKN